MADDNYSSKIDVNKALSGEISFGLMRKGVPPTTAFGFSSVLMLLSRGKTTRVNHHQEIKKQIKKKLKLGLLSHLHIQEIDLGEGLDNLPEEINCDHYKKTISDYFKKNPYDLLIKAKGAYSLVRTNHSGHKVVKIKPI